MEGRFHVLVAVLALALCLSFASADNNKCCPSKDRSKCENMNYHPPGKENEPYYVNVDPMAMCFGITGAGCNGIPNEDLLLSVVPKGLNPLIRTNGDGTADGVVTIGSIYHDSCCLRNPHGLFCNKYNRPVVSFAWKSSDCACADEWRTAVFDLFKGYAWRAKVSLRPTPSAVIKQDNDASKSRNAYMRIDFAKFSSAPVRHTNIFESVATKVLQAPDGTRLACPENIAECQVQCSKDDETAGKCKRSLTLTTRYFKEKGIKAGNSEFCASGLFVKITRGLTHSFGVCGTPTDAAAKKQMEERIQKKKEEILATGDTPADKQKVKEYLERVVNMPYTEELPEDKENALEKAAQDAKKNSKSDDEADDSFLSNAKTWLSSVAQKAYNGARSAIDKVTSFVKWF